MDTREVTERVENLIDNCEKAGHGKKFFADAILTIFAEEREALAEIQHIEAILARRPALADCKTRIDKILLALSTAARAEKAEAREAKLREALVDLRDKVRKAGEHPQRRGEWEDVADALRGADAALATVKEEK